jgi:hypothetical protein
MSEIGGTLQPFHVKLRCGVSCLPAGFHLDLLRAWALPERRLATCLPTPMVGTEAGSSGQPAGGRRLLRGIHDDVPIRLFTL